MQTISLQAVPNQTLRTILNGQQTTITIYQLADDNLYMNVELNNAIVVAGVLIKNNVKIIHNNYFGYSGDFVVTDTQGSDAPIYTGLGTRWKLIYLLAAEAKDD